MSITSRDLELNKPSVRLAAAALAGIVFFAPIVAVFESKAMVLLLIVALILGIAAGVRQTRFPSIRLSPLGMTLIAFVAWALASLIWSAEPGLTLQGAAKLLGHLLLAYLTILLCRFAAGAGLGWIQGALISGFAVTAALLFFEGATNGLLSNWVFDAKPSKTGLFWLNRAATLLALLAWPTAGILLQRGLGLALVPFVMVALVAVLIGFDTLLVALGFSLLIGGLMAAWRPVVRPILIAGTAFVILLTPLGPQTIFDPLEMAQNQLLPNPMVHRFHIWKFASDKISEKPITGHGLNASRTMAEPSQRATDKVRGDYGELLPLHPHNFSIQVWLELGAVGAVLLAIAIGFLIQWFAGATQSRSRATIFTGQFCVAAVLLSFSIGVWQGWFLATLWIVGAATAAVMTSSSAED